MVVHNVSVNVTSDSAVSVSADVIRVANAQELKQALRQHAKAIEIINPDLEYKLDVILKLGRVAVIGTLLAWLAQGVLLRAVEKGYGIEAAWKIQKIEGKLILTPRK